MSYNLPADVEQLLQDRLASGNYASEAEVLREALLSLAEREEDLEAVRSAIAEMEAGDEGIPPEEAIAQIRRTHEPSTRQFKAAASRSRELAGTTSSKFFGFRLGKNPTTRASRPPNLTGSATESPFLGRARAILF